MPLRCIDLFAGWGGFTLGAELAGAEVVWAANHWQLAVNAHSANHPDTIHVCQDLRQADWSAVPDYELLLASPACQGHSSAARGARKFDVQQKKKHDALRATAWAVVDCVEVTEPDFFIVENVPYFMEWKLFPRWLGSLEDLGYELEPHVLTASHHGVPQRRERLYLVGARGQKLGLRFKKSKEPGIDTCLLPDEDEHWKSLRDGASGVRAAAKRGQQKYGDTFMVNNVTGHGGIPLTEPIRTITTKAQWSLVRGDQYRALMIEELACGMGFPHDYTWPIGSRRTDIVMGLGNAVCPPVARDIIRAIEKKS